jgi:hypothetical protein
METPHFSFSSILNLLGAAQALLLALALLTVKRGNRPTNLLLAAFATNTAILIFGLLLIRTRYILVFRTSAGCIIPSILRSRRSYIYTYVR